METLRANMTPLESAREALREEKEWLDWQRRRTDLSSEEKRDAIKYYENQVEKALEEVEYQGKSPELRRRTEKLEAERQAKIDQQESDERCAKEAQQYKIFLNSMTPSQKEAYFDNIRRNSIRHNLEIAGIYKPISGTLDPYRFGRSQNHGSY